MPQPKPMTMNLQQQLSLKEAELRIALAEPQDLWPTTLREIAGLVAGLGLNGDAAGKGNQARLVEALSLTVGEFDFRLALTTAASASATNPTNNRPDPVLVEVGFNALLSRFGAGDTTGSLQAKLAPAAGGSSNNSCLVCRLEDFKRVCQEVCQVAALMAERTKNQRKDALTGLYNRLEFNERLEALLAQARRQLRPLCLVMLDLDYLKRHNDSGQGHTEGDRVLRELASTLKQECRASDTAFRYAGDEFCMLLSDTTAEEAYQLIERIAEQLRPGKITFSAGIAQLEPGETAAGLFKRADEAAYAAKLAGRDRCRLAQPTLERVEANNGYPYNSRQLVGAAVA